MKLLDAQLGIPTEDKHLPHLNRLSAGVFLPLDTPLGSRQIDVVLDYNNGLNVFSSLYFEASMCADHIG